MGGACLEQCSTMAGMGLTIALQKEKTQTPQEQPKQQNPQFIHHAASVPSSPYHERRERCIWGPTIPLIIAKHHHRPPWPSPSGTRPRMELRRLPCFVLLTPCACQLVVARPTTGAREASGRRAPARLSSIWCPWPWRGGEAEQRQLRVGGPAGSGRG
jgi:hypothetical protein